MIAGESECAYLAAADMLFARVGLKKVPLDQFVSSASYAVFYGVDDC